MPYIYNATQELQKTKAFGNWFEFKPKQMKQMAADMAMFIAQNRAGQGLVALSDSFEDPDYKNSPEGKAELADAEKRGIDSYISHLRSVIYNNQVSLRRDLERANMKVDPAVEASEGELEAMRLVAKYQKQEDDTAQRKAEEVRKLLKDVGPIER